jgi:hypothetical protein
LENGNFDAAVAAAISASRLQPEDKRGTFVEVIILLHHQEGWCI